jgi:hypothetical protein
MNRQRWMALGAALLVAMVVAACGGGGESNGYGAIAVSPTTGKVGFATESLTQSNANEDARDECDKDDCAVVLQFEECGAIAGGRTSGGITVYGVAEANRAFDAQVAANSACTAKGGLGCGEISNLQARCN